MNKKFYIGVAFVVALLLVSYFGILSKKTNLDTVHEPSKELSKEQKEVEEWRKNEFSKPRPKSSPITFQ